MEHKQLRKKILKFRLKDCARGNQGYNRVLLLLFGYLGHGKSSLINSCKYALEDKKFIEQAGAQYEDGGKTVIRKSYKLTSNITMVDNRGYNKMDNFQRAEVYAQLGNFFPLDEKVDWKDNFKEMMTEVVQSDVNPNYTDFIVPVLVYSLWELICTIYNQVGTKVTDPQEIATVFAEYYSNLYNLSGDSQILQPTDEGVAPIIVLTHKTSGDYMETEKQFRLIGAESVIAVENYTKESNIKTLGRTKDFLMFIDGAIRQVKFCMGLKRNPQEDRVQRKKFLLQYIHEADCKTHENENNEPEKPEEKGILRRMLGWFW